MENINDILEDLYFEKGHDEMLSYQDLSKDSKSKIVELYIKEQSKESLLESLLQKNSYEEIASLLVDLFKSDDRDQKSISDKLVSEMKSILWDYYNTGIDEILSDLYWQHNKDKLDQLSVRDYIFASAKANDPAYV